MTQRDEHPGIQAFLKWIQGNSQYAILEPETKERTALRAAFMPLKTVMEHFKEDGGARLKELLAGVFYPEPPPVDLEDCILENYTEIFCTLVEIGKGRFIKFFTTCDPNNTGFPFDPDNAFSNFPTDTNDPKFYENFCKKQWKFCAPELPRMGNIVFHPNRILPFVVKEEITSSGSAMLYKIPSEPLTNTYALKTYNTPEAKLYYENEVDAFQRLKYITNSGLIGFCGCYRQGDTFNVILEFADQGTLEQYFEKVAPPVRGDDIIDFWEGMFMTIRALQCIHQAGGEPNEGPQILHGFHQDVKPANILVVSNHTSSRYKWEFKVADLGLSHFKRVINKRESVRANDVRGTRTYGAPECCRAEDEFLQHANLKIKQNVDIWSLGGVFSEAAIWVVVGYNGVLEYRENRRKESPLNTDCFHDRSKVLQAIRNWHEYIIDNLRKSDIITPLVLAVIENHMLVTPDDRRLTATQLCHQSTAILERVRQQIASSDAATTDLPLQPPERPTSPHPPPRPEGTRPISRNQRLRNGLTESINSDQEVPKDIHPRTHRYLEEQHKTIEKYKANINQVENLLSLHSEGNKSLRERDPLTARKHFDEARTVIDTIQRKIESEKPSQMFQMLRDLILEQHLHAWTGLVKCEIDIIDQSGPPLSRKGKQTQLKRAKHYADGAMYAQQRIDPKSTTCEALDLWKKRNEREIY